MPRPKITQKIEQIVNKYLTYLKFKVLGPSHLIKSELISLVKAGLIKQGDSKKSTISDVYVDSHEDALLGESRKSVRDFSLKHINTKAGRYIDKWIDKARTDLSTMIEEGLLSHRRKVVTDVRETLLTGYGQKTSKQMASELRRKTQDLAKDWERVVTTELAQATNMGVFDAIIEDNKHKSPDEIYVYKVGPHDSKTCSACMEFWFLPDGMTPKVYKLSELVANGSNFGKKKAEWKPTVDITHPQERHYLMELPIGWGFQSGKLTYISKNHNEHNKQNS